MLSLLAQLPKSVKDAFVEPGFMEKITGSTVLLEPEDVAALIINGLLSIIGVIFFVLAVYGGFIWMKARGNDKEVERAKEILTNAMIGIILVFAAYAISRFVIAAVTQTNPAPSP